MSTGDANFSSSEQVWDPRIGSFLEQITVHDSTGTFTLPQGAMEYSITQENGITTYTWRQYPSGNGFQNGAGSGGGNPPSVFGSVFHALSVQEPLITHPIFGENGTYKLDAADKKSIAEAEADPKLWPVYAKGTKLSLKFYASKILLGIEKYYSGSFTGNTTSDETTIPNLSSCGQVDVPNCVLPQLPSGVNFLLSAIHADPISDSPSMWRVTREWRGSGPLGWSSSLYQYSGALIDNSTAIKNSNFS